MFFFAQRCCLVNHLLVIENVLTDKAAELQSGIVTLWQTPLKVQMKRQLWGRDIGTSQPHRLLDRGGPSLTLG